MTAQLLKIEKLVYGGEGMGFLNGKVCFAAGALPGETVEVEIVQEKKNFSRGRVKKVLSAAPFRVEPPCPYVADCGGCQYQHIEYAEELKWKEIQVREYLSRNLKIPDDKFKPIQGSSNPYHYRSSVTVHRTQDGRSGFYCEDNKSVIPIESCLLADPRLARAFQTQWVENQDKKTYRLSEGGVTDSDESDILFPVQVGSRVIHTAPKSFFQNNLEITAKIGEKLADWVSQIQPATFVDLYSGVGTFSVLAAGGLKKVICVEENGYSQAALKMNLKNLGIPHEILTDNVEQAFPRYFSKNQVEKPFVFMDPSRTGMANRPASFLSRQKNVEAAAYLSCHLGTLTRDLGVILKEGLFRVSEVIAYDMFPRTKHIEVLVLLKTR